MNDSLFSILELARSSLPFSLFDAEGYARLAEIAKKLPEELTTFWGFECRLGEPAAIADFLFETRKQSRGLKLLTGEVSSSLEYYCEQWPAWQNLRLFAQQWADSDHVFYHSIRNIWLEFDTAALSSHANSDDAFQQPCIFLGPEAIPLEKDQFSDIILDALSILGESNGKSETLHSFVAMLPAGAHVFQVGLMLARINPGLRVCVNKLAPEEIPDWLSQLKWKGDVKALEALMKTITPIVPIIAVDLNLLADGPAEKIGLECYMDWVDDDPHQWVPLLNFIEEHNLCLPQKRQGLLTFTGITHNPPHKKVASDGMFYINLFRKIHHIKLSILGAAPVEAKAYLAMTRPAVDLGGTATNAARDAWIID